jgi:hypothetical protein
MCKSSKSLAVYITAESCNEVSATNRITYISILLLAMGADRDLCVIALR